MKEVRESRAAGRVPFTVRLPEPLTHRLKEFCIANRETLQDVTERVLTEFLDAHHPHAHRPGASSPAPQPHPAAAAPDAGTDARITRIEDAIGKLTELVAGQLSHTRKRA